MTTQPRWEDIDRIVRMYYGYRDIINNEETSIRASIEELKDCMKSILAADRAHLAEEIGKLKRNPRQIPVACPDGRLGCAVYHTKEVLSIEDEEVNEVLDSVLILLRKTP